MIEGIAEEEELITNAEEIKKGLVEKIKENINERIKKFSNKLEEFTDILIQDK